MENNSFITDHYQLVKMENLIFTKWCKKYNILYMDAHLLLSIEESKGISEPTKLSEELLIPKQSITSMLDKLEKKGYILRTHSEKDRRKINISLTDCGRKIVNTIRLALNETEKDILKQINKEEMDNKETILKSYPQRLVLELTNACNLRCIMCGRDEAEHSGTGKQEQRREASGGGGSLCEGEYHRAGGSSRRETEDFRIYR